MTGPPTDPVRRPAALVAADCALIAFGSQRDGNDEIYTVNPCDPSLVTRLTTDPANDIRPAWSPDRTKIAFARIFTVPTLWIMNADGSNQTLVYSGWASTASFSPDGQRLVFTALLAGQTDIAVINVDGTGFVNLTNTPDENETFSVWSPTGGVIAFTSSREAPNPVNDVRHFSALYVMNEDGSNVTRLTPKELSVGNPSWSPDGEQLVFDAGGCGCIPGGKPGLYVIDADGTDLTLLPQVKGFEFEPSFSPSGDAVVFQKISVPSDPWSSDLFVMNLDGTGLRRITTHPAYDGNAAWFR